MTKPKNKNQATRKPKPKADEVKALMAEKFKTSGGNALFAFVVDHLIENPNGATADEIGLLIGQQGSVIRGVIRKIGEVSTRKGVRFSEIRDGKFWLFIVDAPKGSGSRNLYKITKAGKVPPELEQYLQQ